MDDPLAKDLNDIADVEELLPGYVSGIREWFRWYKTPDDKPLNGFGFDEKALGKVRNTHRYLCSTPTRRDKRDRGMEVYYASLIVEKSWVLKICSLQRRGLASRVR